MSTVAEQIAAVKRFISSSVKYADYYGPNNLHPDTAAMRSVLATLEGMAAPGETEMRSAESAHNQQPTDGGEESRFGRESSPPVAPQQPTQEALTLVDELWWILGSRGGDARQRAVRDAADRIDRFAAQRVSAAPVSGDARKAIAKAISPQRWANLNAGEESSVLAEAERLLTAATDKARREALAEVEKWHWQRYIELRDESPRSREGLVSGIAGAHMAAHRESAEYFHTLTPQNPGDAAPEQEGKE